MTLSPQRVPIEVRGDSTIDSGKNIVPRTYRAGVCLTGASALVANGGAGTVDTRAVSDGAFRDATSTVTGVVVGKPFVEGGC